MLAPERELRSTRGTVRLGTRPWVMGVVNASPESFSDAGGLASGEARLDLARSLLAAGADLLDPGLDARIVDDVEEFLSQRISLALELGVAFEQLLLDPGPDLGKTPAQTVRTLRALERLHELGRPLLLAVSRKDFVGAITSRRPRARLAGTLAAIAHGLDRGAHVLRVPGVGQVVDFLSVRAALDGQDELDPALRLADDLRWEQG